MALTKISGNVIKDSVSLAGNVSIGGTLTYQDVTNIDAVGLITARTGIKVLGGGINVVGVVTSTTFSGSGASLTSIPAGQLTGTVPTARLGSGTASSSTFLAGDSTFKTVTGTTINNNANNRLITGSGTANTLEGEANLTFTGSILTVTNSSGASEITLVTPSANDSGVYFNDGSNAGALTYVHSDNSMRFRVNSTEKLRITSSGEMGVNTTAPVEKLGISGNMRFVNPNGNTSRITALPSGTYNTGTSGGSAICFQRTAEGGGGSDEIFFETHWQGNRHGESCRINKYGNLTFPSGQGIDFSADGNSGGTTSELLDDYEEGTYVPTMYGESSTTSFTLHSSEQNLSYHKIGNMVTVHGRIRINSNNFSGAAYMTLPFTAASHLNTNNAGCSAVATHGFDFNNDGVGTGHNMGLFIETGAGTANGWFLINRDNASWVSVYTGNLKSNSYLSFAHTYKAA